MNTTAEQAFHHLTVDQVVIELESNPETGLSREEVQQRLHTYGANTLPVQLGKNGWLRFLLQFHQPLIYILIGAGCITAGLQEWVDSGVIFGVVLVNGIIGFIQEARAENALAALAQTMVAEATVLRQGLKQRLPSSGLVPGDIVLLQAGDRVPADLRLLQSRELQVDESALTGESMPVAKTVDPLATDTVLAERRNMAYGSTLVTFGRGTGIVAATGALITRIILVGFAAYVLVELEKSIHTRLNGADESA